MLYNIIRVDEATNEETIVSSSPMSLTEANFRILTELKETYEGNGHYVYYRARAAK